MADYASAQHMSSAPRIALLFFLALAFSSFLAGILIGSADLPLPTLLEALLFPDDSVSSRILWELRLPRVMAAFLTGGLLALAGLMMQTLLQNPLADPYVLGTSGGAAVAVLLGFMLGIPVSMHPLLAIAGAAASTILLVFIVGRHLGQQRETLLLGGIILTTGWGALITFLLTTSPQQNLPGMLFWLVGDLGNNPDLLLPFVTLLFILLIALLIAKPMNLLLLGDQQAQTLGIPVSRLRLLLLTLAVIATSIAVATAGPVGFIGLVTPHLLRLIIRSDHRWLVPCAVLLGGSLVMLADLLARILIEPRELPVGIFTAMIGVPVFLLLLKRQVMKR